MIERTKGYEAKITIEYNYLQPLKYYLEKINAKIINIEYLEKIEIEVEMIDDLSESIEECCKNNNFSILKYEILREKFVEI